MNKSVFTTLAFAAVAAGANAVAFSYTSADGTAAYNYTGNTSNAFSNMYLIADNNTVAATTASIVIAGSGLNLSSGLTVSFTNLGHSWIGDTTAWLSNGTSNVILWDRPGATGATSFGSSFNFDPNASYSISEAGSTNWTTTVSGTLAQPSLASGNRAPLTSAFSQIQPTLTGVTTLGGLNGVSLDGTWTINIVDRAATDFGAFRNFTISGEAVPEPASMTALALGAAAMLRRRRAAKK